MPLMCLVPELTPRRTVRGVVIADDRFVLLMKIRDPVSGRSLWITPGGGVRPGEAPEVALRRELREELSFFDVAIGPDVWSESHQFEWAGQLWNQDETYYLIKAALFEPRMAPWDQELRYFLGYRWWLVPDITRSTESFAPANIGLLLEGMQQYGPPANVVTIST